MQFEHDHWVIIQYIGTSGKRGDLWETVHGYQFVTQDGAVAGLARLAMFWDLGISSGSRSPAYADRFHEYYRILFVRDDQTCVEAIEHWRDTANPEQTR